MGTKNFESNMMEYAALLNNQEMLTKTRNINFVSKVVMFHGLCRCWYQERVKNMQNNNNLKSNSVQSTSRQIYDCYLSRDVYAEAFKAICCFTVTIIKEEEVHNVNNLNNYDQEILYELRRSNFILRKSQSFLCG